MKKKLLTFGINILLALLVLILSIWALNKWLHVFTRHGEAIEVPEVIGVRMDRAIEILEEGKFRYVIIDSVYRDNMKKMDIVEQDPLAGSYVKKGRTIYLIVNALDKPQVQMPRLTNKSFNLAKVLLQNSGLKLGNVEYKKTHQGDGLVLAMFHRGDTIKAYSNVEKGSTIDLHVSIKPSDEDDEFDEDGNPIHRNDEIEQENND